MKFGIITSDSKRSLNYLSYLIFNRMEPEFILHCGSKNFLKKILKKKEAKIFFSKKINSPITEKILAKYKDNYIIFGCGLGTKITSKEVLRSKIIHAHPGLLPEFKGSAVFFYSIILNNCIKISIIRMNHLIDGGKLYVVKKIKFKEINFKTIDLDIDRHRIEMITNFLKSKKKIIAKKKDKFNSYYIPHPAIRKLSENIYLKNNLKN